MRKHKKWASWRKPHSKFMLVLCLQYAYNMIINTCRASGRTGSGFLSSKHFWRWAHLWSYRYHGKAALWHGRMLPRFAAHLCRPSSGFASFPRMKTHTRMQEVPFLEIAFPLSHPFIYLLFDAQNSEMGLLVLWRRCSDGRSHKGKEFFGWTEIN